MKVLRWLPWIILGVALCRGQQWGDGLPFTVSWTEGKCAGCKWAEYLHDVQFTAPNEAWGIGNDVPPEGALDYIVVHTIDGGRTWYEYPRTLQHAAPPDAFFFDAVNGWMAYWDQWGGITQTKLARTSDGGKSWRVISRGLIDSPVFADRNHGIAIKFDMYPNADWLRTADGGRTWTELRIPHLRQDARRCVYSGSTIWIVQEEGPNVTLFRTTDGGQSWEEFDGALPKDWAKLREIRFLNRNRGWVVAADESGNEMRLLATIDGGRTWAQYPNVALKNTRRMADTVAFVSESVGFLFEEGAGSPETSTQVWFTEDGGLQWLKRSLPYSITSCQAFAGDVLCAGESSTSNFGVLKLHPPHQHLHQ